jgi:NADH dehydrogenase (ubiquinone) 1 alpha/beta subcomplex 1
MSLSAAAHAVRAAVLRHMRLGVQGQAAAAGGLGALAFARGFAGGHFLDKGEVTERVLNVTKHFEKIQADKVRGGASACALSLLASRRRRVPRARRGAGGRAGRTERQSKQQGEAI